VTATRILDRSLAVLCLAALIAVAGCGYQLRGQALSAGRLGTVFVQTGGSQIGTELLYYLEDAGVSSATDVASADTVISMSNEVFDRRVLTVDPNTGRPREYELQFLVTYSARSRDGASLISGETLSLTRDYVFDDTAVIGASREEGVLLEEMRRDAVLQILSRLDGLAGG